MTDATTAPTAPATGPIHIADGRLAGTRYQAASPTTAPMSTATTKFMDTTLNSANVTWTTLVRSPPPVRGVTVGPGQKLQRAEPNCPSVVKANAFCGSIS